MIGSKVRDKDAVSAVALLCEMAAYEKNRGKSLYEKLIDLYLQYGFYKEHLISITKKGMDGQKQIADMMDSLSQQPTQKTLIGTEVVQLLDYERRTGKDLKTGKSWEISLPESNVLQFILADGSKISARPSGTEPKIKFYFSVYTELKRPDDLANTELELNQKIQRIIADLELR